MKHIAIISLFTLHSALSTLNAGIPTRWTVETSRPDDVMFEAFRGETIDFAATMQSYGKPLAMSGDAKLYWQTNGMADAYWEAPATVASNVIRATWMPEMDVGARAYRCFLGIAGATYRAAFKLRMKDSPGATPSELPLPVRTIDFAKVSVINPPWPTNAVTAADLSAATNGIRRVDGAARPLPKYLHELDFCDSYPDSAEEYYRQRGSGALAASCSAVRDGGFLYRNFDFPFDDRAEFVVHMSSGSARFASVGVAQVGTNLTEATVTSGKPSRWYKSLPGATVDGINENGVVCDINVVDTPVTGWHTTGDLHPLAAVRWVLDNATNAQSAAEYIAANIHFPQGWTQNFHWMVADERETWIVENGTATSGDEYHEPDEPVTMTNFQLSKFPWEGMGMERFGLLLGGANITNAWYTRAYLRTTNWASEFKDVDEMEAAKSAWETHTREQLRGHGLWQTVHTSVYDISNRVLRVAVQETDDWYTFAVPPAGTDENAVRAIAESVVAPVESSVSRLSSSLADVATEATNAMTIAGNAYEYANDAYSAAGAAASKADTVQDNLDIVRGEVSAADAKANSALVYSSGVYQYMNGNTNAWFEGTNYPDRVTVASKVKFAFEPGMDLLSMPCSMALRENRDRERQDVWDQRDWTVWYWNFKSAQASNAFARVIGKLSDEVRTNCMKRGWAKYTAVQGLDNPDPSTLWIDTPKIQLMAGHQWEKLVELGGAGYWTLTGNGVQIAPQDAESTFLTIKDFEGNACLTFRKTSSYLVYCECGTDIVDSFYDSQGRAVFHLTTDVQPTAEFSTILEDTSFVEQNEEGCPADFEWTGSTGSWDCHFKLKEGIESSACFARFKILREGENVVEHTIPIKINGGIAFDFNGQTIKCRPVPTGTSVGSTVNWVVAQ